MTNKPTDEPKNQQVAVHRVYTKGCVFEAAALTQTIMANPPTPVIDLKAQVTFSKREEHTYEVVLHLHLVAKNEGNLLWQTQFQQAGLYTLTGFNEEQTKQVLNGFCPTQMYPYASAEVSHLVSQAGFPPVYLAPMNFDVLYQQQRQKEAAETPPSAIAH